MKVLVADELSAEGLEVLRKAPGITLDVRTGLKPAELKAVIGEYDVLAVRSATKVTADALRAPAAQAHRPGRVGVDNIDVEAATRKGVTVMNTPGGNSVAVAELTRAHAGPAPALVPAIAPPRPASGRRSASPPGTSCSARRWG
jgi:phosphoglycerate dehydrogenase-like enzyme